MALPRPCRLEDGIGFGLRYVIRVDTVMFGGTDPSRWLQEHLGSARWLAIACTIIWQHG